MTPQSSLQLKVACTWPAGVNGGGCRLRRWEWRSCKAVPIIFHFESFLCDFCWPHAVRVHLGNGERLRQLKVRATVGLRCSLTRCVCQMMALQLLITRSCFWKKINKPVNIFLRHLQLVQYQPVVLLALAKLGFYCLQVRQFHDLPKYECTYVHGKCHVW